MSKLFGKHLRELRKSNTNFSQQEMADMLNISRSTYTYYETGKSEPGQEKLRKICKILNTDFNTLLGYFSDNSSTVLVAEENDDGNKVSSLTPYEEQIILAYRSMNSEEKEYIGKQINKMIQGN